MIDWKPVDVLACLEVEPTVNEEATSYRYTISRQGLVLALEIWPYDGDVWLALRQADQQAPLLDFRVQGCREIRYLRDGEREELYFVTYDERPRHPVNVHGGWRLQVAPHVEVKLGPPPTGLS